MVQHLADNERNLMTLAPPVNIWSGTNDGPFAAALTNPTALAKRKGKIVGNYPITWEGIEYADVEEAYQRNKPPTRDERVAFITALIVQKLNRYPGFVKGIHKRGGIDWLSTCSHLICGNTVPRTTWEGREGKGDFLRALIDAWITVTTLDGL